MDLVKDIKKHLQRDYLRSEFNLIAKKIPVSFPERDYWINLLHEHQKLENIFHSICIPCVCTYSSDLFTDHNEETQKYLEDFEKESRQLKSEFDKENIVTNVDVILMLLPIPSKEEFVTKFDERLKNAQRI